MNNELTRKDIEDMEAEIEHRKVVVIVLMNAIYSFKYNIIDLKVRATLNVHREEAYFSCNITEVNLITVISYDFLAGTEHDFMPIFASIPFP